MALVTNMRYEHNGPQRWVHIKRSYTNLEQISISESWWSINFKISNKHQHLEKITEVKNPLQRRWDHYRGRWPASCRQMHNAQLARTWTKDQNINHEIHCVIVSRCQKWDLEFWPKFKRRDQVVLSMFPNYDGFDTCRPVWYWRCRWSPCIHWCLLLLVEFVNNFQSAVVVDVIGWYYWNKSFTKATVLRLWSTAVPRTGLMRGSIRMIEIQLNWPPKHIYYIYVKTFRD